MKKQLSELKQSDEILEIRRVNPVFVSRYRQAMRKGDTFPPLIIDENGVVICGNHRYVGYLKEFGEDYEVDVEQESFNSDSERIKRAVEDNATHGNPLDGVSRKRAVLKLIELGEDEGAIAQLLGCSVKRITQMAGQHVIVRGNDGESKKKPLKRGVSNIAGKTVSKEQYEAHDKRDRAMSVHAQAEQLTRWLENGWVDMEDTHNIEALRDLAETLDEKLAVPT